MKMSDDEEIPLRKILVPLDGSEWSFRAAKYAVKIAKMADTEIVCMHAVVSLPSTAYTTVHTGVLIPMYVEEAQKWYDEVAAIAKKAGDVTDMATGFPGYDGKIPKEKATIAAAVRMCGYNRFAVGKWRNTPAGETGPEGPFDRWPTGEMMGFDRFYGFLGGGCNQWYPPLVWDNHPIAPPKTPEEGYHLSVDLVDKAILFISNHESVAPEKPWFMWLAFGAAHAPHHVSKEWAGRYKGRFDPGWDKVRDETLEWQKGWGLCQRTQSWRHPMKEYKSGTIYWQMKRSYLHA
jgi:Sulfatase/Universal stress protein family